MSDRFTFDGLAEKIIRDYLPEALQAGADVIKREMKARTPVRQDVVEQEIRLKDSLVTDVTMDRDGDGGTAEVGYGAEDYIARFVEFGHAQVGHKPGKQQIGRVPARPFMRPAASAAADGAIEAVADSLAKSIEKGR